MYSIYCICTGYFINVFLGIPHFVFLLYRVEFHLSESGDIFWKLPQNVANVPYIVSAFDFYRVTGTKFHFLRFIGGQSGEWFDFNVSV